MPCNVITTAATQITCRVDDSISKTNGDTGIVVVYLKTYEEAKCDVSVCGAYTYTSTIPTIETSTARFDVTDGKYELVVKGFDMPTSTSEAILSVGGEVQVTKSITGTEAVFTLDNLTSEIGASTKLLFT